jgi:hypothetical protein
MEGQLGPGDLVLVGAARFLIDQTELGLAESLIESTEITLRYGDSWWDGNDGYIYDTTIQLTADPGAAARLERSVGILERALGEAIAVHTDPSGDLRKSDLVRVDIEAQPGTEIAGDRREARRRLAPLSDTPS